MKAFRLFAISAVSAILLGGCTDDEEAFNVASGEQGLTIGLAVPVSRSVNGSPSSDPTANECAISDLRLIAFPQGKGTLINTSLRIPPNISASASTDIKVEHFTKGEYRIYVIANMGDEVAGVTSETQLKEIILNYGGSNGLPVPGNLPMVYEPQGTTTVSDGSTRLDIALQISCVKVDLNLIFDKATYAETAGSFGSYGLRINKVTAQNVSTRTNLVKSGKVYDDHFSCQLPAGTHYGSWTRTDGNESVDDRTVIENRSGAFTPSDGNQKWVYSTTLYLPERYVTTDDNQTYLEIEGRILNGDNSRPNAVNHYRIPLGHTENGHRTLPRDTYYEVIGTVKSIGEVDLDAYVSVKPWSETAVSAEIRESWLKVDRTSVDVSSTSPAEVHFTSSIGGVTFECGLPEINGKKIIEAVKSDDGTYYIFRVNPGISAATLTGDQAVGTVKCSLKAGNITKYIDVHYNITPFFDVDYKEHVIYWGDQLSKVTRVTTNLDGVRFPWTVPHTLPDASAQARVQISCEKVRDGVWDITMTLPADPGTTTEYTYSIGAAASSHYNQTLTPIKVILKPQPNKYRLYMRAINDRMYGNYPGNGQFAGILSEYNSPGAPVTSNNWQDGWSDNNQMNGNRHRAYVYYQYGETTGDIPASQVWEFHANGQNENSRFFPGGEMTGDTQNPGWYYIDFSLAAKAINKDNYNAGRRDIKPGETLVIFSSNWDTDNGFTIHRFTHHRDPGISLFNYDDCEGWYLYDPTCDPYYRVYDERPTVEDVTYTIYYKGSINGWYHIYGVADNSYSNPARYTIYAGSDAFTRTSAGGGWYRHTFRLKAPRGEYEKAIQIKFSGTSAEPILFNGASWTEGYYDGAWHRGKPAGVTL